MSLTIDEAIARFEANAEQSERWASCGLNPEANAEYAAEHRQLAAWLRELQELRKAPEIVRCGECVNFAERGFCKVAGHNVHRKSNCMQVFGAERRTE